MTTEKTYLGDGLYGTFDGYGIELTTENGRDITNRVYLEPEVYASLVAFVERLRKSNGKGG